MDPVIEDKKTGHKLWRSVRELPLRFTISIERNKKFFEGLKKGVIMATKCVRCERIYFPPQTDCPYCKSSEIVWVELSGKGVLLTFTKIFVKPRSFSHYRDYVVAVGRLDEGVNVTAWIDADISELRVGMPIELRVVKRDPEGYLTYEWKIKRGTHGE